MTCVVCNDCEGWEFASRAKDDPPSKPRPRPFHLRATFEGLADSAENCITCRIFRDGIAHFMPELSADAKIEGWIPMKPHLPRLSVKQRDVDKYEDGELFEFYTVIGNSSLKVMSLSF